MQRFPLRTVLFAVSLAIPAFAAQPAQTVVLPTVAFDNLDKERVTLPAELQQDRNLLLLYFQPDQQADVDAWNAAIDRWHAADPSFGRYTSLVSPQKNFLSRWWQNASLRSASPNATHWRTTVPLYVNEKDFLGALGIESQRQVVVLLLDRQGHLLDRFTGPATDAARATVKSALDPLGKTAR